MVVLWGFVVSLFVFVMAANWDYGKYDYCVEWDGWIHRDNMIFNCYDIINDTAKCSYGFQDDGSLLVWHNDGSEQQYSCSRYVKSKEVYQ